MSKFHIPSAVSAPPAEAATLTGPEAARFTNLSAKTLDRHAAAGEPVGRIKVGRRVLYLKTTLEAWLMAKAAIVKTQPTHQ
jgi:hypothetical protein